MVCLAEGGEIITNGSTIVLPFSVHGASRRIWRYLVVCLAEGGGIIAYIAYYGLRLLLAIICASPLTRSPAA